MHKMKWDSWESINVFVYNTKLVKNNKKVILTLSIRTFAKINVLFFCMQKGVLERVGFSLSHRYGSHTIN